MLPAHAGVILPISEQQLSLLNVTRTRGGDPCFSWVLVDWFICYPHTRGDYSPFLLPNFLAFVPFIHEKRISAMKAIQVRIFSICVVSAFFILSAQKGSMFVIL